MTGGQRGSYKLVEHEGKVLDLQKAKDAQANEIAALKKRIRVRKEENVKTYILKRLRKIGMTRRVESLNNRKFGSSRRCHPNRIKAAKPKVVTTAATTTTTTRPKDKMVGFNKRPTKETRRRSHIALIESWENTQAMMEADRLLAERLQSKEREELTDEEKAKLFMELMEKRRKHYCLHSEHKGKKKVLLAKAQKDEPNVYLILRHMLE
ncbi:hypothetical protein Tco_0230913 [Tanacetum coccineum]